MVSKSQIKLITSLKQKKQRQLNGLFVAEGIKTINELLDSHLELHHLFACNSFNIDAKQETIVSENELKKISFLKTPNSALALFKIPEPKIIENNQLIIALDDIRDPGNLGTIIRLCDWFGIKDLVCSSETADCYNPKAIQATMGSISRVNITYLDLETYLEDTKAQIYGAFMDGDNMYSETLPNEGILVMGNEAKGISEEVARFINKRISIPRFGNLKATESLNVATATAILLSEFKRPY